jgi:maltose alpha-D-glucosyltransferase/alpha-amylase
MVTDRERDYLWQTYAYETRARINLGIRRRLAPLLDNDRRKIELLNSLLMSMPGTPVVYYGDEIGMGDNIYLGDRDGVRTPMQWTADRNGGFSRANPQKLYLPTIMDPVYGFDAVNVEAQQAAPASLLNWMKRLITVRKAWKAFGRGEFVILYPRNRKILAYLRRYEGELILCVVNLSRGAQAVELDLSEFAGHVPVELLSRSPFPPIGELPYLLTLAPYGFYWFSLEEEAAAPDWHSQHAQVLPEFATLVSSAGWQGVMGGRARQTLEQDVLPMYLKNQRWFSHETKKLDAGIAGSAVLEAEGRDYLLSEVSVGSKKGQAYSLPLAVTWGEETLTPGSPLLSYALAKVRRGPRIGALHEAVIEDAFVRGCAAAFRDRKTLKGEGGVVNFQATEALGALPGFDAEHLPDKRIRRLGGEQSNTTVMVGDELVMKLYRRLFVGAQPELEMTRFLTEVAHFRHTPALLGWAERVPDEGEPTTLMIAFANVPNQGDAWRFTLDELDRVLEEAVLLGEARDPQHDPLLPSIARAELLGRRSGEMHAALATPTDDKAFAAEPIGEKDIQAWVETARKQVDVGLAALERQLGELPEAQRDAAERLLSERGRVDALLDRLAELPAGGTKIRVHGDYHLGQVLVAEEDFSIIDFEGEPRKTIAERRRKQPPMRDVAGMLRSFDYAAWSALDRLYLDGRSSDIVLKTLEEWRTRAQAAFLNGYFAATAPESGGEAAPAAEPRATDETERGVLELFLLEKAFYEIDYEAAHRPKWLHVPVRGALELLDRTSEGTA